VIPFALGCGESASIRLNLTRPFVQLCLPARTKVDSEIARLALFGASNLHNFPDDVFGGKMKSRQLPALLCIQPNRAPMELLK